MHTYLLLLRGINVGGKNILPMAKLREVLQALGCVNVTTYIASGNVILQSPQSAAELKATVEATLVKKFQLDSQVIKVLVLTPSQVQRIIDEKPPEFGDHPEKFHSDVIFLIDIPMSEAWSVFNPREGVDTIWQGGQVIYSQRLSEQRTKSRLGKIVGTKPYQSMTIRTWGTTSKLLELLKKAENN